MPQSMTGFVSFDYTLPQGILHIDIKSVNHRYLVTNFYLPENLHQLELEFGKILGLHFKRGKLDIKCRFDWQTSTQTFAYDKQLAEKLAKTLHDIDRLIYNAAPVKAMDVLSWPGVLREQTQMDAGMKQQILQFFNDAANHLADSRINEGQTLSDFIQPKNARIREIVSQLQENAARHVKAYEENLRDKLKNLMAEEIIEPARIAQEVVLFAQKTDITEELERLLSHCAQVEQLLTQQEPVGRKLDFLMQEMNREANTLGSKSAHIQTTDAAIELKVLIEQMREQIQNIE